MTNTKGHRRLTDVSPVAHSDGGDGFGLSDELSPSGACGVNSIQSNRIMLGYRRENSGSDEIGID
jgi:hypothetical protein